MDMSERLADERPAQRMTPVMAEDDGILRNTRAQVDGVLRGYRQMFDITCLVDPGICMELTKKSWREQERTLLCGVEQDAPL